MRNLVIGDIHGAYAALKQIEERAAITDDDHVIFIGDAVDGWHESKEVVEWLISHPNLVWVRGNHDAWFQDWLLGFDPGYIWWSQGGYATLKSFSGISANGDLARDMLRQIKKRQCDVYRNIEGYVFVHGGLLGDPTWDRSMWIEYSLEGPYGDPGTTYVCGHTALQSGEIERRNNVVNVDCGAGWAGRLACWDITNDVEYYSDPVRELYPGEHGRG